MAQHYAKELRGLGGVMGAHHQSLAVSVALWGARKLARLRIVAPGARVELPREELQLLHARERGARGVDVLGRRGRAQRAPRHARHVPLEVGAHRAGCRARRARISAFFARDST